MSFNEKLQYLRKANKLSQEQLADMLDVTRQSVSKWESGTTYPEMDKLITMCKIFKCSLDDLTNDEVTEINVEKKTTNNSVIGNLVSSVVDIIEKTVKMLRAMSAKQIVGLIFTLLILASFLMLLRIPFECLETGFYGIIKSIPNKGMVGAISGLFNMILDIAFFALYVLAFMYIYKLAYLDKYEFITKDDDGNSKKIVVEEKEDAPSEVKEVKIVQTSSPKDNTLFCFLGNIILWFFRIMTAFCIMPFVVILVVLFAMGVIALFMMFEGIFYIGVLLGIVFAIVLTLWVIELGCIFIFNKKASFNRLLWTFLIGLSGIEVSVGLIALEISNSIFLDSVPAEYELKTETTEFSMRDDLAIDGTSYYYRSIEYVVDNSLNDKVVVTSEYYDDMSDFVIKQDDNLLTINLYYSRNFGQNKKLWDAIKKDLANKTFRDYDSLYRVNVVIKSSEENIAKLKDNSKEYLDSQVRLEYQDYYYQLEVKISDYESELDDLREENDELKEKIWELEEYKNRVKDLIE